MLKYKYILIFKFAIIIKAMAGYHVAEMTCSHITGYTYQCKLITWTDTAVGAHCQESINFSGSMMTANRANGATTHCFPAHDGVAFGALSYNQYYFTYTYPGPGNYVIEFEGANRNAGIINMSFSQNQTLYLQIPLIISPFNGLNNSSNSSSPLITQGCLSNGCYYYNSGTTDVDGDSLAYSILPCRGSGGAVCAGYGFPAGTFSINPTTGTLSWCTPQMQGNYNVVMKVDEWRKNFDGTLILAGSVSRDIQINISSCVGINEFKQTENTCVIYPNPTDGILNIECDALSLPKREILNEIYDIKIMDALGQLVLVSTLTIQHSSFNISHFNSGIYYVKIFGNKGTNITKKIIKN